MKNYILVILSLLWCCNSQAQISFSLAENNVRQQYSGEEFATYNIYQFNRVVSQGENIYTVFDDTIYIANNSYIFFVDKYPQANWMHDCEYLVMDVDNGNIKKIEHNAPPKNLSFDYNIIKET